MPSALLLATTSAPIDSSSPPAAYKHVLSSQKSLLKGKRQSMKRCGESWRNSKPSIHNNKNMFKRLLHRFKHSHDGKRVASNVGYLMLLQFSSYLFPL